MWSGLRGAGARVSIEAVWKAKSSVILSSAKDLITPEQSLRKRNKVLRCAQDDRRFGFPNRFDNFLALFPGKTITVECEGGHIHAVLLFEQRCYALPEGRQFLPFYCPLPAHLYDGHL